MKKFNFRVESIRRSIAEIEANSLEEAQKILQRMLDNGEYNPERTMGNDTFTVAETDEEIGYRICSHCGKKMEEGYYLNGDYACSDECAIALYDGDEEELRRDLEEEDLECGSTDCYWTEWLSEI